MTIRLPGPRATRRLQHSRHRRHGHFFICNALISLVASVLFTGFLILPWQNNDGSDYYISGQFGRLLMADILPARQPSVKEEVILSKGSGNLVKCNTLNVSNPVGPNGQQLVRTSSEPSFLMAIHSPVTDQYISRQISQNGCFECPVWSAAMHALKNSPPDTMFLDIGSNIGLFSLTAAALGYQAYAFEPYRRNYERICESLKENPAFSSKVAIFGASVKDIHGEKLRFDLEETSRNMGASTTYSIADEIYQAMSGTEATEEQEGLDFAHGIAIDKLDDLILPRGRPVVLKVDVVGQECLALQGAMDFLRQADLRYVSMETTGNRLMKHCPNRKELFRLFEEKGLRPHREVGNGEWEALDVSKWGGWKPVQGLPIVGIVHVSWSRTQPTACKGWVKQSQNENQAKAKPFIHIVSPRS